MKISFAPISILETAKAETSFNKRRGVSNLSGSFMTLTGDDDCDDQRVDDKVGSAYRVLESLRGGSRIMTFGSALQSDQNPLYKLYCYR